MGAVLINITATSLYGVFHWLKGKTCRFYWQALVGKFSWEVDQRCLPLEGENTLSGLMSALLATKYVQSVHTVTVDASDIATGKQCKAQLVYIYRSNATIMSWWAKTGFWTEFLGTLWHPVRACIANVTVSFASIVIRYGNDATSATISCMHRVKTLLPAILFAYFIYVV